MKFVLKAPYEPAGDQPQAIERLAEGVVDGYPQQTLLGVTGSGKTFSLASVIAKSQLPTLVISHNKTLAAQLYQEFRDFFPKNAVSYFVSYYDYYQPEAYIPQTDTYIEKETSINDEIDKLRLSATANLLSRPDCIVVASVSCIYNLGSPLEYGKNVLELIEGQIIDRQVVLKRLVDLQYTRLFDRVERGSFRVVGETVYVWPANEDKILQIRLEINKIKRFTWLAPLDYSPIEIDESENKRVVLYAAKHYISDPVNREEALSRIRHDLELRLKELKDSGKVMEAYRLEQKVNYDLEMIQTQGFVNGIENYSRYFDGRKPGDPPFTLLDYMAHNAKLFGKDKFLTVIDESHITLPQIRGMYRGDQVRKEVLIDYGFRLPSARDNRPLTYTEFAARVPQVIYTSATPNELELSMSKQVVEQLIRPTGLLEPEIEVRPIGGQVKDLIREIVLRKKRGERVLVTVLTKKMAEDLTDYLTENVKEVKVEYLHADVHTLDRSDILDSLRLGEVDVIVGINLLREGLDLPEVSLVAILDADKEGFLRSRTSLVQTMGRAARHVEGRVILYADKETDSMKAAIEEVRRRRDVQAQFNIEHNISPLSIAKPIREKVLHREKEVVKKVAMPGLGGFGWSSPEEIDSQALTPADRQKVIKKLKVLMNLAAKNWEFERAAKFRDAIAKLES